MQKGDPMFSSASRVATELNADAVQLLEEERMLSSGNTAGKRMFRKSNTPEKYRSLRRSGGGPRQQRG